MLDDDALRFFKDRILCVYDTACRQRTVRYFQQTMDKSDNTSSCSQAVLIGLSMPYIEAGVDAFSVSLLTGSSMIIAAFVAAHGLSSKSAMKAIFVNLIKTKKLENENHVLVVHNDLPTNNRNTLFDVLNEGGAYFSLSSGRSFYEQCLPPNSLSIGYSSSSLHWLSRKPYNVSNLCVPFLAPEKELALFKEQARLDLSLFLQHR